MDNRIKYSEILGVQLRELNDLNDGGEPSFSGDIYMDNEKVGSFEEDSDGGPMGLFVDDKHVDSLKSRMDRYFAKEGFEVQDDEDYELFFIRLIELQKLLELFQGNQEKGIKFLVADFTDEELNVYEVENEEGLDQLILEEKLEEYDVYGSESNFVIR